MAVAFLIALPDYEIMLVAMTDIVVTRFRLVAHGKPISLLFLWDLQLESRIW